MERGLGGEQHLDESEDGLTEEALSEALAQTPYGAFAVGGIAVGLLMLGWTLIYLFVFLPRGQIG